jgi:histidinol-phosphate aminotransferase
MSELNTLGFTVIPSHTNFILFKFKDEIKTAKVANDFLLNHGFILRYYDGQGLEKFLRLSVGTETENKEVISLLKEFMEK